MLINFSSNLYLFIINFFSKLKNNLKTNAINTFLFSLNNLTEELINLINSDKIRLQNKKGPITFEKMADDHIKVINSSLEETPYYAADGTISNIDLIRYEHIVSNSTNNIFGLNYFTKDNLFFNNEFLTELYKLAHTCPNVVKIIRQFSVSGGENLFYNTNMTLVVLYGVGLATGYYYSNIILLCYNNVILGYWGSNTASLTDASFISKLSVDLRYQILDENVLTLDASVICKYLGVFNIVPSETWHFFLYVKEWWLYYVMVCFVIAGILLMRVHYLAKCYSPPSVPTTMDLSKVAEDFNKKKIDLDKNGPINIPKITLEKTADDTKTSIIDKVSRIIKKKPEGPSAEELAILHKKAIKKALKKKKRMLEAQEAAQRKKERYDESYWESKRNNNYRSEEQPLRPPKRNLTRTNLLENSSSSSSSHQPTNLDQSLNLIHELDDEYNSSYDFNSNSNIIPANSNSSFSSSSTVAWDNINESSSDVLHSNSSSIASNFDCFISDKGMLITSSYEIFMCNLYFNTLLIIFCFICSNFFLYFSNVLRGKYKKKNN